LKTFLFAKYLRTELVSSRHVSTLHDTFDASSVSRRACRAVLFDKLDTAKMHGLDTSNVSCHVVSRRDVTSQVKFGLIFMMRYIRIPDIQIDIEIDVGIDVDIVVEFGISTCTISFQYYPSSRSVVISKLCFSVAIFL